MDKSIPVALVINELISNSLKYGFVDKDRGEIGVRISKNDNMVEIVIYDDGVGIPKDFDMTKTNTLGLYLVKNLIEKQLKGTLELDRDNKTEFKFKFPI